MEFKKELLELIETLKKVTGKTQAEISQQAGYGPKYISEAISKDNVTLKLIDKIKKTFKDELEKTTFTTLDEDNVLSEPVESYVVRRRSQKNREELNKAPLVSVKAQAGYVRSYDQTDYVDTLEKYALPPGITYHGAVWRYFEIEGNSMNPTFANGDIVLASQVPQVDWEDIRNFYIYVLITDTRILIKRIFAKSSDEWVLISDNEEEYEQVLFDTSELKELWIFRRHLKRTAPPPKQFEIKI